MIAALRWREDEFDHVLLVGRHPFAEVRRVPGKAYYTCKINAGDGLRTTRFDTLEKARSHAEREVDGLVRQRLNEAARKALQDAGL